MERAYDMSVRIMTGYSSLVQLCIFMNLPVDVPKRLKEFKSRREYSCGQIINPKSFVFRCRGNDAYSQNLI